MKSITGKKSISANKQQQQECSNTEPAQILKLCFFLCVLEARAEISGPAEKYLKPGSGLKLQCTVLQSTENPQATCFGITITE